MGSPRRGGGVRKIATNRRCKDALVRERAKENKALVRQHGEEGAWYLEHLLTSSSNPYLRRAVEDIKHEAEVAEPAPTASPRRVRTA